MNVREVVETITACKVDFTDIEEMVKADPRCFNRRKLNRLRIAINDRLRMLERLDRKEIDF